jgi:hypothetical protein
MCLRNAQQKMLPKHSFESERCMGTNDLMPSTSSQRKDMIDKIAGC